MNGRFRWIVGDCPRCIYIDYIILGEGPDMTAPIETAEQIRELVRNAEYIRLKDEKALYLLPSRIEIH